MNTKFIILDRDGVINYDSVHYIKSPNELNFIPGSLAAIAKLNQAGYQVMITTNQSGVGRGFYTLETLHEIHNKLRNELNLVGGRIEGIFFCPHHPQDKCKCRKPEIGMFHQIKQKYPDINFAETFYVGDSFVDMQAAFAITCKPILVLTSNGQKTLDQHPELQSVPCFANLAVAVDEYILI